MSETIRIKTIPNGGDTYVKLKLDQDFDFIDVLSLKLSQEDVYKKYCSDYGVIVGRVSINNGFGVPNAMVSVFIPLDDIDIDNPEIRGLYPYEVITDTNDEGVRYNLLPKDGDVTNPCRTPIGTFPNKREVLDNEVLYNVYTKYYKFTTTTNHAGDFMIFGVPLGTYTVHVDADISDIGIASQRPYDLINQGTPISMFGSTTKFKADKNLNNLLQVKTMNAGVNVQPFWGDTDNCEIGINRLDFDLNYKVIPSAIFIGSIYGDQDKHSINKNCRPRQRVGELCSQITSEGSIYMLRKTLDNKIEQYDVDGGRVIDESGVWSYQIPMNLDYMVTDESGNLIYSQDPNVGIATRASVRFNIGMDNSGGEGRLRTRARYLVPNNPTNSDEVDYEFGPKTKDTSFRDLYWNKIYTVSNYISRFQPNANVENRNMTGVKNVDDCVGDKTPFPYNKVDTKLNPIFVIICLIIQIISVIFGIINKILVPAVNGIISVINGICGIRIPGVGRLCRRVDYMPCLSDNCSDKTYAPGCKKGSRGWNEIDTENAKENDGWADCKAFDVAKELDIFKFDFYNDWVHGSLFSFLLKYKKTKDKAKFCDYECQTTTNRCEKSFLVDSCFNNGSDSEDKGYSVQLSEGLIKKYNDELYYASTKHTPLTKMFATDIANLGSVFDCDWQGIPKIANLLIPTTYKIPPDTEEINSFGQKETCGMVSVGKTDGLFFGITCKGVNINYKGCLNIRHICEMGVDIDETQFNPDGTVIETFDCVIGSKDIDDDNGKWFRDVFFGLNKKRVDPWIGINNLTIPSTGYTTSFNLTQKSTYDFTAEKEGNITINGADYINFRGYPSGSNNAFGQTNNSYYFYFGLLPGKSAIDKMNAKYFATCTPNVIKETIINDSATPDSNLNGGGSITFTFVGGNPPFTYTVIGLNYYISGTSSQNQTIVINNLSAGTYTLTGTDSFGYVINKDIVVYGAQPLLASATVTKNATTDISNDGEITIDNVIGGVSPYTYTLFNNVLIVEGPSILNTPLTINNLPINANNGYTVMVIDSVGNQYSISGLTITGVPILGMVANITNNVCSYGIDGVITMTITGGQLPYSTETIGPNDFLDYRTNLIGLENGSYITTITDSLGTEVTYTNVVTSSSNLVGFISQSDIDVDGNYTYTVTSTGGVSPITGVGTFVTSSPTYTATITDSLACEVTVTI